MVDTIILSESCAPLGQVNHYLQTATNRIKRKKPKSDNCNSILAAIITFFRELLLPQGYPESVSADYLAYQTWDTLQAFCSTVTGIFTTQAVLKSVGVGDATASALSATFAWILKDGAGMLGRVAFAWWKGAHMDGDCKKWRLCADAANDLAMALELGAAALGGAAALRALCAATVLRALVGVAGGATRASIAHHQAARDNMAEIAAKDGSQETIVNLVASVFGLFLLNNLKHEYHQWMVVVFFLIMHLYANYRAVCSLVFTTLNNARMDLILKTFLEYNAVLGPERINRQESVILGFNNCESYSLFSIQVGKSLRQVVKYYEADDVTALAEAYATYKFLPIVNMRHYTIQVCLENNETPESVIGGYYAAVLLGIAIQLYNKMPISLASKRQLHYSTPVTRLKAFLKNYQYSHSYSNFSTLPNEILADFAKDFLSLELDNFFTALKVNGWRYDQHALYVGEWRCDWKSVPKKYE